ncbi:MAG: GFA family protein [Hyphomicrobiaceae bacterium]
MIHEGQCMCGAVRFSVEGEPVNVRACHCRQCQRALGSPFFARALFEQRHVDITGPTAAHLSSQALERVFCRECGTRMFARRTNGTYIGIALAAFNDKDRFAPTEHIWVSEKVAWLRLDDGLPQHPQKSPSLP